jgi:hypothetical protein
MLPAKGEFENAGKVAVVMRPLAHGPKFDSKSGHCNPVRIRSYVNQDYYR